MERLTEKINGWTFEETVKSAENLMEAEENMFKWDVLRHLRDFAECYKGKIAEYEDLEEQDLLLRLPCNPEDKIYAIHKEINEKYYVKEHEVSNINISKLFILIRCCDGFVFNASDMGKLAFLTQAEAEQKLKEMERD